MTRALLLTLLMTSAGTALAAPPTGGEVFVIHATEQAGELDASLKKITALRKPPFSSFKTMKVLSRTKIALSAGKPVGVTLPNGRQLQLKLLETLKDGRHKVQVSINKPGKKDYLPLLQVIASREPFFVAGQKYQGGMLIIGVRIDVQQTK